ncbi:nitric oxide-associated protein 1-like [Mugil cephalus]|uniref:nitric oxide-associated protein 1-like n=1 Tax=Mugil cephalus TaxID=48193 RepID=UPI001FB830DE|nr:nitric oxide-associated protein 1-like [Mugil cephalus]
MLKLVQVCVRRQVWRSVCSSARRLNAASGTGGARTRQGVQSCTVDPEVEEQFVFVDCTDPEEDPHHEERDFLRTLSLSPVEPLSPGPGPGPGPQKQLRSLQRQLQVLQDWRPQEAEPDSLVQFHDVDFPLDQSLVAAQKKKKKKKVGGEHKVYGTPDVDQPVSDTCCSGCGALLHCTSSSAPGYLPSEKYKVLVQQGGLRGATCQRCHLLTHHHKALNLKLSKDQYRDVVQQIRPLKALVLLIVDLLDLPDSIVPDLPDLVGTNKHILVLGNKADLLPRDAPDYLQRIRGQLSQYCCDAGFGGQVTGTHLISAKTGYGIEDLISSLQRSWRYSGDVYLVGSANAGKSTLFNTLLDSDYCKTRASDLIHKATISPWPGTTLNLLRFPIINPTPSRMFKRQERLKEEAEEEELPPDEVKRLKRFSRHGYLVGRVGRTFRAGGTRRTEIQFDPDHLAFGELEDGDMTPSPPADRLIDELSFNEVKDAHWLYDTPGILKEQDILNLLTEQEVMSVVPTQAIVPRTVVLKPGMSLFVGALARIDFLQGDKSCWFSVVASSRVPVHVTSVDKADAVYEKHAGHVLLGVPTGGSERMKEFPALVPQEFRLEGGGYLEAVADVKLSSAGWVAVTAARGDQLVLKVHGPAEVGFGLRTPPLLPHVVSLKGKRIRGSAAYKPMKTLGLQDGGLRMQLSKRKKKK